MKLIEKINGDFMTAYKAKEIEKKDFLGVLKTEVTKESKTPEDTAVVSIIKSMIKNAAKTDSLTKDELVILEAYLPKQMDKDELTNVVKTFITDNGLSGMPNMGKVMGYLKSNFDGEYDGGLASKIVKENL